MIAVDAMGGDFAPHEIVDGALRAARTNVPILLFGDALKVGLILTQLDPKWQRLPIVLRDCSESIGMADEPARSITLKKDSSLVRAIKAVQEGEASAIVSAGNSGAALVGGMVYLGKISSVLRPAVGSFLPTRTGFVFCVDLGGNVDCKPEYLRQFACMGDAYVRLTKDITRPRIALLSNGAEQGKGNKLTQQVYDLLAASTLNFVGNCEPTDIFNGIADVVVCEGFSGNIMLKSMEATVHVVMQWLKDEKSRSWWTRLVGLLSIPVLRSLKKHITKEQRGGALLLGLKQPLIIAHGAARAHAIEDAILFAQQMVADRFYPRFNDLLVESLSSNASVVELCQEIVRAEQQSP